MCDHFLSSPPLPPSPPSSPPPLQTVNNFRAQYFTIFRNSSDGASADDEDNNLVVRSFTDDPEIPLRQIRVRNSPHCYHVID